MRTNTTGYVVTKMPMKGAPCGSSNDYLIDHLTNRQTNQGQYENELMKESLTSLQEVATSLLSTTSRERRHHARDGDITREASLDLPPSSCEDGAAAGVLEKDARSTTRSLLLSSGE